MEQAAGHLFIRQIRESRGIDIERFATMLRMDLDTLRRIENQELFPQISDLLRIANALHTDITALTSGKEFSEKHSMVTRRDKRVLVNRRKGFTYESLAPYYSGKRMEPFVITLDESNCTLSQKTKHAGEEFHYILEGSLKFVVGSEEHLLEPGDSFYFDSCLPHCLQTVTPMVKMISVIYNGESMLQLTRSKYLRDIIHAAQLLGGKDIAVVCPDDTAMDAVNKGIEEGVIANAYLIGDRRLMPEENLLNIRSYHFVELDQNSSNYHQEASAAAVTLAGNGTCHLLMKGQLNTSIFVKAVLNRSAGLATERRLSLVSLFELPEIDRLIFLTDPGINPTLIPDNDIQSSRDIINNVIDLAHGLGVARPKVALLEANEVPSEKLPSSVFEQQLTGMDWGEADVYGPLSYDLALYEEAAEKKGFSDNSVAGRADVLVVPYISAGNFLYKAWAYTLNAEVANIVVGARVPLIITSRNDTDKTKFLTICASSVFSHYLGSLGK